MLKNKHKIAFVCSSGGHLFQLFMLKPFWEKHERYWVTFDKKDAVSLLKNEKRYNAYYPTNRNIFNLIRNTFLAIKILFVDRPTIVISNGAAVAVPFFYLAKILKIPTVYIEVFDRISSPTLTGRIVYPCTDAFIIQWVEQKKFYKKGIYCGELL